MSLILEKPVSIPIDLLTSICILSLFFTPNSYEESLSPNKMNDYSA